MAEPGFEPRVAGWELRLLPLCYAAHPSSILKKLFRLSMFSTDREIRLQAGPEDGASDARLE